MQITKRERNILILASLVGVVFIATQLLPAIQSLYGERQIAIEDVLLSSTQELRLVENAERWQERRQNVEAERAVLSQLIFTGATAPLIEASIQSNLSQIARDANIDVNSTRLAERLEAGGWLMISQEMSFRTTDAANTLRFFDALANSTPRLHVKDFSLDRNRNFFTGEITVVGFARSADLVANNAQARR